MTLPIKQQYEFYIRDHVATNHFLSTKDTAGRGSENSLDNSSFIPKPGYTSNDVLDSLDDIINDLSNAMETKLKNTPAFFVQIIADIPSECYGFSVSTSANNLEGVRTRAGEIIPTNKMIIAFQGEKLKTIYPVSEHQLSRIIGSNRSELIDLSEEQQYTREEQHKIVSEIKGIEKIREFYPFLDQIGVSPPKEKEFNPYADRSVEELISLYSDLARKTIGFADIRSDTGEIIGYTREPIVDGKPRKALQKEISIQEARPEIPKHLIVKQNISEIFFNAMKDNSTLRGSLQQWIIQDTVDPDNSKFFNDNERSACIEAIKNYYHISIDQESIWRDNSNMLIRKIESAGLNEKDKEFLYTQHDKIVTDMIEKRVHDLRQDVFRHKPLSAEQVVLLSVGKELLKEHGREFAQNRVVEKDLSKYEIERE